MSYANNPADWSYHSRRPKRNHHGNFKRSYARKSQEKRDAPYDHQQFGRVVQVPCGSDSDEDEPGSGPQAPEIVGTTERPSKIPKLQAYQGTWSARYGIIPAPFAIAGLFGKACLIEAEDRCKECFKGCVYWMPGAACAICGAAISPRSVMRDVVGQVRNRPGHVAAPWEAMDRLFAEDMESAQNRNKRTPSPKNEISGQPQRKSPSPRKSWGPKPRFNAKSNQGSDSQAPPNSIDDDDEDGEPKPGPASGSIPSEKPRHSSGISPSVRPRPTSDILPAHLIPARSLNNASSFRTSNHPFRGGRLHMPSLRPSVPLSGHLNTPPQSQAAEAAQSSAGSGNAVAPPKNKVVLGLSNIFPTTENAADIVVKGLVGGLGKYTTSPPSLKGLSRNKLLFRKPTKSRIKDGQSKKSPKAQPNANKSHTGSATSTASLSQPIDPPSSHEPQPPPVNPSTSLQEDTPMATVARPKIPLRQYFPRPQAPENLRKLLRQQAVYNAWTANESAQASHDGSMVTVGRGSSADRKANRKQKRKDAEVDSIIAANTAKAKAEREQEEQEGAAKAQAEKDRVNRKREEDERIAREREAQEAERAILEQTKARRALLEATIREARTKREALAKAQTEEEKLRKAKAAQSNQASQTSAPAGRSRPSRPSRPPSGRSHGSEAIPETQRICEHCTMHDTSIHREFCVHCSLPLPQPLAPQPVANAVVQIDRNPDTLLTWPYPNPRDRETRSWVTYSPQSGPDDSFHDPYMMTGGAGPAGTLDAQGNHEVLSNETLQQLRDERRARLDSQSERERWRREARVTAQEQRLNEPVTRSYRSELTAAELAANCVETARLHRERDSQLARRRWAARQQARAEEARVRQQEREARWFVQHALRAGRTVAERQEWVEGYRELSGEEREQLRQDMRAMRELYAARVAAALRLQYNSKGDWIGPEDDEPDDEQVDEQGNDANRDTPPKEEPFLVQIAIFMQRAHTEGWRFPEDLQDWNEFDANEQQQIRDAAEKVEMQWTIEKSFG